MTQIHLRTVGQGKPLVLFHGWGFDSEIWSTLLPQLTKRYTLYLVDLPGFGLSSLMDWTHFKSQLLQQLPQQFALAGWSMGGLYATKLASEASCRVTHLMNIASSPYFIQEAHWPGIHPDIFSLFYEHLSTNTQKTLEDFIQLQLKGVSCEKPTLGAIPSKQALKAGLDVLSNWDLRESLVALTTPVAYLFGGLDAITVRRTMTRMQALYPDFHYILLSKAAHVPFLSHPQPFIEALDTFFQNRSQEVP